MNGGRAIHVIRKQRYDTVIEDQRFVLRRGVQAVPAQSILEICRVAQQDYVRVWMRSVQQPDGTNEHFSTNLIRTIFFPWILTKENVS
jgi:hypothetical protein